MNEHIKDWLWLTIGVVLLQSTVFSILAGRLCPPRRRCTADDYLYINSVEFWIAVLLYAGLGAYLFYLGFGGLRGRKKDLQKQEDLEILKIRADALIEKLDAFNDNIRHFKDNGTTPANEPDTQEYPKKLLILLEQGELTESEYRALIYDRHNL